jgi:hypothetical protein
VREKGDRQPWPRGSRVAGPLFFLLAGLAALACLAQSELPREVLLLARIRQKMGQNLTRMPDYTCLETIERSTRPGASRPYRLEDTVRLEVAHVGTKELYSWPGAQKFEERGVAELVGAGMTSSGDFVLHLRAVFADASPTFTYRGEEETHGRRTVRYEYSIPQNLSGYRLRFGGRGAVVGCSGSFWADPETLEVVRLEVRAEDIPPDLPVLSAVTLIDYAKMRVGASEVMLPQRAELLMTDWLGRQSFNRTEFTLCRQYVGESVVIFVESEITFGPPAKQKK